MSKKVKWYLVAVVLALAVAGGAYAAWAATKSHTVSATVLGTFSFTVGECTDCYQGEIGSCSVDVRNDTEGYMKLYGSSMTIVPDNELVTVSNVSPNNDPVMMGGTTQEISWDYTPEPGCESGEVVFTITLTCDEAL